MSEETFKALFQSFAVATAAWINLANEEFRLAAERIERVRKIKRP